MMLCMESPNPPSMRSFLMHFPNDGVLLRAAAKESAWDCDLSMTQSYSAGVATRIHCFQTKRRKEVESSFEGTANGEGLSMQKKSFSGTTRRSDSISLTSSSGKEPRGIHEKGELLWTWLENKEAPMKLTHYQESADRNRYRRSSSKI